MPTIRMSNRTGLRPFFYSYLKNSMKKLFFSFIAMMIAAAGYAQTTLVATLTHGDETSMFYGAFALRDAQDAAVDGDIVNLSGGSFQAVDIAKALTVRGTGVDDANPTCIIGNFSINLMDGVSDRLSFEGCRITGTISLVGVLSNAYFLKSYIGGIDAYPGSSMINGLFVNCQVHGLKLSGSSSVQFVNSYVENYYNGSSNATASFTNCVINEIKNANGMGSSQFANCIFCSPMNDDFLPSSSSASNCVAAGSDGDRHIFFQELGSKQNCQFADLDIFQDSDVCKDLTEEAKAEYLGTDGTPVGMYGGTFPYDMTPTYPRITKMNVASKSTADGKLSVEVEVSALQ